MHNVLQQEIFTSGTATTLCFSKARAFIDITLMILESRYLITSGISALGEYTELLTGRYIPVPAMLHVAPIW